MVNFYQQKQHGKFGKKPFPPPKLPSIGYSIFTEYQQHKWVSNLMILL